MEKLEHKFIELILNRCLNFKKNKSLLIHCDLKEHIEFAKKVKKMANKMGIYDVCIHVNDLYEIHDYLKHSDIEDIKLNPLIDRSDWNTYAMQGGNILFINSPVPNLMDDIENEKLQKWLDLREQTTKYYRKNVSKYVFPWCIISLPNIKWAESIFGKRSDAYDKLFLNIMKMCMVDRKNPILAWDNYIKQNNYYKNKLNELNIKKMHLENELGTDLTLELPYNCKWLNLDKDAPAGKMISNMPSYEIFTSPDFRKTNGIVYSTLPLFYEGSRIEDFYLEYKDGKVINIEARIGKDILENIIFENKNACFLGEVALVPKTSPVAQTGLVYNNTLFDENSSSHLAQGRAFPLSLKDYNSNFSSKELLERGINVSDIHVDFMIGSDKLNIEAETDKGRVLIFKDGNFNL